MSWSTAAPSSRGQSTPKAALPLPHIRLGEEAEVKFILKKFEEIKMTNTLETIN